MSIWKTRSQSILEIVFSYLTSSNLLLLLLGWTFIPFLYQMVYYRFFHPLRHYPGLFWGTVTILWYTCQSYNQTELTVYENLFKQTKAPLLRISPTTLLVKSAFALPLVYHRTSVKSRFYAGETFASPPIFNILDHQVHSHRRRLVAPPYSYSKVLKVEPLVDKMILPWFTKLNILFAETQKPVDMAQWATYVSFDTIGEVGFSQALGFVENEKVVGGLIQSVHEAIHVFGVLAHLHPFMQWLATGPLKRFFAAKPDMKNGIGQLMRWRDKIINARITEIDEGRRRDRIDLLQSFFEAKTPEGKPLGRADIEAEVLVLLLAGADTTGTAFSSTLTNIISSPGPYSRMMMEIDSGFAKGSLSQPIPKAAEVSSHCPFYVSCVKESLLLSPPSPALFPREVTADQPPLIIDGKIIPIGSEITFSPFLTNRDQKICGEDADISRPERWLEDGGEKAKMFYKYNFTWGYGSRICLGKDLAIMELMKFPLMFFRNFNVGLCAKSKETPGPPRLVILGGLFHLEDIWLNLKKRKI